MVVPEDPVVAAWRGGSKLGAQPHYKQLVVTKAEFETYDPVNLKKQVTALAASIEADIDSFQKATPDARPFPSPSRTPVFST